MAGFGQEIKAGRGRREISVLSQFYGVQCLDNENGAFSNEWRAGI